MRSHVRTATLPVALLFLAVFACRTTAQTAHWSQCYYQLDGQRSYSNDQFPPPSPPPPWAWQSDSSAWLTNPPLWVSSPCTWVQTPTVFSGHSAQCSSNGKITMMLRWVTVDSGPDAPIAPNPPPTTWVKVTSLAAWTYQALGPTASGTVDNGQGDAVVPYGSGLGASSSGSHLKRCDSSQGVITLDVSPSASGSIQTSMRNGGWVNCWVSASMAPDTRGVTISSGVDPTFYRTTVNGVPTAAANVRFADGTLYGDTVAPGDATAIAYTANPLGTWGTGSYYHWMSNLTGYWDEGTWSPGLIPDLTALYSPSTATPGATDHVHLRLIDSANQANCTANYYLRFHNKYEDWSENQSLTVNHPYPTQPPGGDWTYIATVTNGTDVTQTLDYNLNSSTSLTESGTIGDQLVTQATDPAGFLSFQHNESITSTTSVTSSISTVIHVTVPAHKTVQIFVAPSWTELYGACSTWGSSGYLGDSEWYGVKVPNAGGQQVLSVAYYQPD